MFRIFAYYALGAIMYGRLEGWGIMDSIYFMTVTATTVGYGDLSPATRFGKLFSVFYSILGFTVVMAAIAPLLSFLQGSWRERLLESIPLVRRAFVRKVDLSDMCLTIHDVNKQINYPRRYALCLIGPLLVFALVALVAFAVEGFGLLDSAYFSLITMSTIGYGDLSPASKLGKAMAIVYLPLAVVALADAISRVAAVTTRRTLRRRDYAAVADEMLLRNCVRNGRNPDFSLREAEFLVAVLLANDILDSDTLNAIRRQFRNMVRNAEQSDFQNASVPPLTPKMAYAELVERRRVPADMDFDQWYKEEWIPRVQAAPVLPLGSAIEVPNFPLQIINMHSFSVTKSPNNHALNLS
eukprot:TRINITY_DN10230_c0_g1_i1.p1 TRINITY_DN10230_c0_g1~~TRINITY_DN10230_c0_g1_i1.p1  ORF type:complete len:354 (-),score=31.31 TRINITY_DN10230_c0_g1_i1:97-1158(-)